MPGEGGQEGTPQNGAEGSAGSCGLHVLVFGCEFAGFRTCLLVGLYALLKSSLLQWLRAVSFVPSSHLTETRCPQVPARPVAAPGPGERAQSTRGAGFSSKGRHRGDDASAEMNVLVSARSNSPDYWGN